MRILLDKRWGDGIKNPTREQLLEALQEVREGPQLWAVLTNLDVKYSFICVFGITKLVTFGRLDLDKDVELQTPPSEETKLRLWELLCEGNLEEITKYNWQPRKITPQRAIFDEERIERDYKLAK